MLNESAAIFGRDPRDFEEDRIDYRTWLDPTVYYYSRHTSEGKEEIQLTPGARSACIYIHQRSSAGQRMIERRCERGIRVDLLEKFGRPMLIPLEK